MVVLIDMVFKHVVLELRNRLLSLPCVGLETRAVTSDCSCLGLMSSSQLLIIHPCVLFCFFQPGPGLNVTLVSAGLHYYPLAALGVRL